MSYPISVVPFHGDSIVTLHTDDNQYVALKPICAALGIDRKRQQEKIQSEERWGHKSLPCQTPGGTQEMICIPLRKLNGWLFSINPNKVRPDLKQKVIRYQEECFEVLHDYWRGETVSRQPEPQNPFDRIDTQKLTCLQSQSKQLAWEYLNSLGIEQPKEQQIPYGNARIDLNKLAEGLRPIAKEYDYNHFFVHISEMNNLTHYRTRETLRFLAEQNLLLLGETDHTGGKVKYAKKANRMVAKHHFNGKRKRVYVLSWKLLEEKEGI